MSKATRERARQRRTTSSPRSFVIIGTIAVLAVAGVAARMLMGGAVASSPELAAAGPPLAAASGAATPTASGRTLLFFMNPDGYPCQTQLGILNSVSDSLSKLARVVYVKTTEPADLQKFEAYGIRGLPSLVIADENGREISRFSPGIQSGETVLAALTR